MSKIGQATVPTGYLRSVSGNNKENRLNKYVLCQCKLDKINRNVFPILKYKEGYDIEE